MHIHNSAQCFYDRNYALLFVKRFDQTISICLDLCLGIQLKHKRGTKVEEEEPWGNTSKTKQSLKKYLHDCVRENDHLHPLNIVL